MFICASSINIKPAYAVDVWSNHVKSFGLRAIYGIYDLPTGKKKRKCTHI
jgi:hypothetical protein